MSGGQLRPDYQSGACRVSGAAGTFVFSEGNIRSILRTGLGVWEIGVASVNPSENAYVPQVISSQADDRCINIDPVSNSLVRCRGVSIVGGVVGAADLDFYLEIHRVHTT